MYQEMFSVIYFYCLYVALVLTPVRLTCFEQHFITDIQSSSHEAMKLIFVLWSVAEDRFPLKCSKKAESTEGDCKVLSVFASQFLHNDRQHKDLFSYSSMLIHSVFVQCLSQTLYCTILVEEEGSITFMHLVTFGLKLFCFV